MLETAGVDADAVWAIDGIPAKTSSKASNGCSECNNQL
jgi:hypothetical protein